MPERALFIAAMGNIFSFLSPASFPRYGTHHLGLFSSFWHILGYPSLFFPLIHYRHPSQPILIITLICWFNLQSFFVLSKIKHVDSCYLNSFILMGEKIGIMSIASKKNPNPKKYDSSSVIVLDKQLIYLLKL